MMTFEQVRDALLSTARRREICDLFEEIRATTTYPELIREGLSLFEWGWRTGIVTTAILDEIPDVDLINQGIYYNKSGAVVANPTIPWSYKEGVEIWLIGGDPSITLPDGIWKVNVYSTIAAEIITNFNSFVDIKFYNAAGSIRAIDNSIVTLEARNNNSEIIEFTMEDNANVNIDIHGFTQLLLDKADTPYCTLNTYNNSIANIIFSEDDNVLHSNNYQSSKIIYNYLL